MLQIGPYKISQLITHTFGLDGGAMFGVVPKTIWDKLLPADARNRIPMCTRVLILESPNHKILIDLGCGDKFNDKLSAIYDIQRQTVLPLQELLLDLTHVLITHVHFDHVGGVSYLDSTSTPQLSFPNAEHVISKAHYDYSATPNIRERASFFPENLKPLSTAKLRFATNHEEVLPGIRFHETYGHTKAMCWVEIFSNSETLAFVSDLIPTSHHLPLQYVMGYDLCAETSVQEKEEFLSKAAAENWSLCFEHDREVAAGKIELKDGRAALKEVIDIPLYQP